MNQVKFIIIILMALSHNKINGFSNHNLQNINKTNDLIISSNISTSFDPFDDILESSDIKNLVRLNRNVQIDNVPNNNDNKNDIDKPKTCVQMNRKKFDKQPIENDLSRIKKCCPHGESLYQSNDQYNTKNYCDTENYPFDVELVSAVLYDNCIEDLEEPAELEIEAGNPCNISYIYSSLLGDQMFVIQDGRLLVMDKYGNESYELIEEYCLDVNHINGYLIAYVCSTSIESHISRGQTYLFAFFMGISIPCLVLVALIHFIIKELRTVHGLSLAVTSLYLAIGYALHIYAQLNEDYKSKLGYFIQFCMLGYFLWFCLLCFNIFITVWYFLPRYLFVSRLNRYGRFTTYTIVAILVPLGIVLYTYYKRIPGMPSFFYQAWSESIQESQRYFIKPVSVFIGLGWLFIIASYFGFKNLDKKMATQNGVQYSPIIRTEDNLANFDKKFFEETKKDAQCTMCLVIIITIGWLLEVCTFLFPGVGDHMAIMEIMNSLQGAFILMIFVVARDRRTVIVNYLRRGTAQENSRTSEGRLSIIPGSTVEMIDMTHNKNDA